MGARPLGGEVPTPGSTPASLAGVQGVGKGTLAPAGSLNAMIINITAYDHSRARPRPPVGNWVMSMCGGACRKEGSREYPRASKKVIQDTCTQPARPRGGREATGQSSQGYSCGLFPKPASGSEPMGHKQAAAAACRLSLSSSLRRPLGAHRSGGQSQHWAPGGAQDPGQACSLPGPRRISKIRGGLFHASGSSCSEGLCLTYAGPQSGCAGTHRQLLSLREGTADGLIVGWVTQKWLSMSVCVYVEGR